VDIIEKTFIEWLGIILNKYGTWFIEGAAVTLFIAILGTLIGVLIGIAISAYFSFPQVNTMPKFTKWLY